MNWQRLFPAAALSLFAFVLAGCCARPDSAPVPEGAGAAAAVNPAVAEPNETSLFDGRTLGQWEPSNFAGGGEVRIEEGQIILPQGVELTGITWTGDLPRMNYEITLEAMRVEGHDFFCGLTFPINDDPCSFIVGGWGGGVVGISNLDHLDAANNSTTRYRKFESGRWYRIRLRITPNRIDAWIDDEHIVDVDTTDHEISIRNEVEPSVPLGIATWRTTAAIRNIKLRMLE